jgi:hypothetical protein
MNPCRLARHHLSSKVLHQFDVQPLKPPLLHGLDHPPDLALG